MRPPGPSELRPTPDLRAYVPRLLLEWEPGDEPDRRSLEGSVVFADISGFTRLSERLAKLGQVGSEELTLALDTVLSELLTAALGYGGSMLKFGGDATLLLFWGEGHAARAAASALAMQQAIADSGRITTPAGTVRLRMSVGVACGHVELFLTGELHRELIVAGPAAAEAVVLEGAASPGQVLAGASLLESIRQEGHQVRFVASESGAVLRGLRGVDPVTPPPVPAGDPSTFLPTALRRHLAAGGHDPEHRVVAVAFISFGGIEHLMAGGGANEAANALDAMVRAAQDAAEELEVTFLSTDVAAEGGKIILVSGAPNAVEQQEERLVRATQRVVTAGGQLRARAGLHRGPVYAGDVGPSFRRTYTVLGDVVNTAARVAARAAPGQVLATPEVLDRTTTVFEASPIEPFSAKGKRLPVHAAAVGEPTGQRRGQALIAAPLVGRETELTAMLDVIRRAAHGRGGAFDVVGESGHGKTRLLTEVAQAAADVEVLSIRAEPYDTSIAWHGARSLLLTQLADHHDLLAALKLRVTLDAPDLLPWLPLLAAVLGVGCPPTPEVEQLADAAAPARVEATLVAFLEATVRGPALIVVDDAHWLDPASMQLVGELARRSARTRWVVATGRRPGGAAFPGATLVELGPLPLEDVAALAWAAGRGQLLPQRADELAARSGGVPLFALELVAAEVHGVTGAVPDTLAELVAARIDRLAPPERAAVRAMAVLGGSFPVDLGEQIVSLAKNRWAALDDLVTSDGTTATFRQPLFQEVAYAGLPHRQRRRLHQRLAEHIEATSKPDAVPSELLAVHFGRAGDDERAHLHARSAGEGAEQRWAQLSAARWYRDAALHADRAGEAVSVIARCRHDEGRMLLQVGDHAGAASALAAARRRTTDPGTLARLMLLEGEIRQRTGRYRPALGWYRRGIGLLERGGLSGDDRETLARLRLAGAAVRTLQGRWAAAIAETAKALTEMADDDRSGRAYGWFLLHQAHLRLGKSPPEPYAEMALAVYEELGDHRLQARILNTLGMAAHMGGDWDRAIDCYSRSRSALLAAGDHLPAAAVANNLGELLVDRGRASEAGPVFRDALAVATASAHREYVNVITGNLARVAAIEGRFAEADGLFAVAQAGFAELGAEGHAQEAAARQAERLLLEGRYADAMEACDRLLTRVAGGLEPLVLRVKAEALLGTNRLTEAAAVLRQAVAVAAGGTARAERERALELLATLDAP